MSEARGSILVVDDEFSVRDSLESWFRRDGFRTGTAESGEEALARLRDSTWDVVLADIRMAGMDGLELQRRVHAIDPELPVILITAYASVESAVKALKNGAFDYVTKPILDDEMSSQILRLQIPNGTPFSELFERTFVKYTHTSELISADTVSNGTLTELTYSIGMKNSNQVQAFLDEIRKLKAELRRVTEERDILK